MRLIATPCTITTRTRGADDAWGDPTWTETSRDALCHVNERSASEDEQPSQLSTAVATIYLEPDETISEHDSIEVDGRVWEVAGSPAQRRRAPTGAVHHLEVPAMEIR